MTEITIPQLGESILEATIGHWLKRPGDPVASGEPVLEIETDKVTMEVPAPADGVLGEIRKAQGDTANVGEVVGTVEAGTGGAAAAPAPQGGAAVSTPGGPSREEGPRMVAAPAAGAVSSTPAPTGPGPLATPTPSVRRLAKAYHVEIENLQGSGPHGQVTREDVEAAGAQAAATSPVQAPSGRPAQAAPATAPAALQGPAGTAVTAAREERIPMSRRRLTIARQLLKVHEQAAMLTTFNEIDLSSILKVRAERRDRFKEEHGVSLGFMSFFASAVIGGLKLFPRLNAEIQGQDMVLKHHYDLGIAVSTDDGLVVPVLRDADRLNFVELEQAVAELARRARKNALTLEDLRGGTFTITNGGVFGSLFSTPILNPPQVGILGMHAIQQRPMAVDGHVEIRPMMYVALSYDHRIVDGSEAVRFLATVKRLCEDPIGLLLEG